MCGAQRLWSVTTKKGRSGHRPGVAVHDDLVNPVFATDRPDRVWLTDITEHPTIEGRVYWCVIKDVYSTRIVDYAIKDRMTAGLVVTALRTAVADREPTGTVIVHSDRSGQFFNGHFGGADRK